MDENPHSSVIQASTHCDAVTEDHLHRLRDTGFSDREGLNISLITGYFNRREPIRKGWAYHSARKRPQGIATDMFSVIIPALNEASCIVQTLQTIPPDTEPVELIVADGGSMDATRELAAPYAHVVVAPRGRAVQMNAGAAAAAGDVLVFLHADTRLPEASFSLIRSALEDPRADSGTFRLRFDVETPLLRVYSFCTGFPLPHICFGDRALFVRRTVFEKVGGFPALPIFEDLELVRVLHRRGGFRFLPQYATTAARRFLRQGPLRQQLRNTYLWCHFMLGTDPDKVARYYPYDAP